MTVDGSKYVNCNLWNAILIIIYITIYVIIVLFYKINLFQMTLRHKTRNMHMT